MTYTRTLKNHEAIAPQVRKTEDAVSALARTIYGNFKLSGRELRELAKIQTSLRELKSLLDDDFTKLANAGPTAGPKNVYYNQRGYDTPEDSDEDSNEDSDLESNHVTISHTVSVDNVREMLDV